MDVITTSEGPLRITPVYHATLVLEHRGVVIWVDPWSKGDLTRAEKADFVFITDIHQDHLDAAAVDAVKSPSAVVVGPEAVAEKLPGTVVLKNGETKQFPAFSVEAVPMYNLKRGPEAGQLFHVKGRGNGYLFTFADRKVYVAGDTECTDEMRALKNVDVAFVPMNLPYTMPPEEAAECVEAFSPKIVYPYHYRGSDLSVFQQHTAQAGIEVRLRQWY